MRSSLKWFLDTFEEVSEDFLGVTEVFSGLTSASHGSEKTSGIRGVLLAFQEVSENVLEDPEALHRCF